MLSVADASIEGVQGLSQLNSQLLRQRGAIGDPKALPHEASEKVVAMAIPSPCDAMKSAIILCALAVCANAQYYILDTIQEPKGAVTFWGTLRYDAENFSARQKECVQDVGIMVNRGDLGGATLTCPGTELNLQLGLYFPQGYNGTITEVYDFHNKLFYPCVRINNGMTKSYGCGGILMQDVIP
ncbi:hypothetical protein BGX34_011227 [Mortierella sp. NVP85]|nr:hypothetical protein BGX34_011227 [Mortierella sp. NVP85]